MKTIFFNDEITIDDEDVLRKAFKRDDLFLEGESSVSFSGKITLGSNIKFSGHSVMLNECIVDDGSILSNAIIGSHCHIRPYSIIKNTKAGARNTFGPFCFIRDDCSIQDDCILGSHIEMTRSNISSNVKISHRAFIADASIGCNVIIGAGVIFCNYDGSKKCSSNIDPNVTIGSGSIIVSPVSIGESAVVGAGSIITKNIGPNTKIIQKRV